MNLIKNIISGILIGAGAILPGISSGVICIILGLYEKILDSILGFFKDTKNNFKFLFPIGIGGIIGILIFSKIILYCFNIIPVQIKSLFIGFLLGSLYSLYKTNIDNLKFKKSSVFKLLPLLICFIIGIILIFLENILSVKLSIQNNYSFLFLISSGFFMSMGIIIPGVSSTVILMLLGAYNTYLNAISSINLYILFPMFLGIILGCFIFMKIIKFLLNNLHSKTILGIIGFSLGSIFILYPRLQF